MNHRLLIQATRIGLYSLVVVLTLVNHLVQEDFFNWILMRQFYGLSLVGLAFHLLASLFLEPFFNRPKLVFFSFFLDIALISTLMVTSGLNQTLFLFLYLVTILLAGLVMRMRGGLLLAAIASICFTVASWFGPEIKAMSFVFILILNNIAFFVVAGLAGYISDQLNLFQEKLDAQNLTLSMVRRLNEMIIETIPSGLLTVNSLGEVLQYNPGATGIFKKDILEGESIFSLIPVLRDQVSHLSDLKTGKKFEVKYNNGDETNLFDLQVLPQISDFEVPTYLVVIEDLTEKRKMEVAVQQAEKMAAVGGLAAGIAHEIRNPLAGISGSIELLSQNFESEDDRKLGRIILREIDRLNRLISEFLEFSKPEKVPVDPVALPEILKEVTENAKLSLPIEQQQKLKIVTHLTLNKKIFGHSDKLKQAFLNIVINALQAMDKVAEPVLEIWVEEFEGRARVRIKDIGAGMKPETQKRMFEPFHTTKAKGTGLGLAITHKILQSHLATIFVNSQLGLGTEFQISFPLSDTKLLINQQTQLKID